MSDKLNNFLIFQLGWLVCAMAGGIRRHWFGTALVVAAVLFQFSRADQPGQAAILVLLALLIGLFWDSLLVRHGVTMYAFGQLGPGVAPHWIIALWALLATTLNLSLRWLRRSILLAALFGAIGGPLAYLAGARLGSVSFGDPGQALLLLAIGWAVFTPLLVRLATRFDGFASLQTARA